MVRFRAVVTAMLAWRWTGPRCEVSVGVDLNGDHDLELARQAEPRGLLPVDDPRPLLPDHDRPLVDHDDARLPG